MKKTTVLLLSPDVSLIKTAQEAADAAECELWVASTSCHAFRVLEERAKDLDAIIIDTDPGAHGLALLNAVGSFCEGALVLVVTGLEESYVKPIVAKCGASSCIGKPLDAAQLRAFMSKVPTRSHERQPAAFAFAGGD